MSGNMFMKAILWMLSCAIVVAAVIQINKKTTKSLINIGVSELLNALADGVVIFNAENNVTQYNEAAHSIFNGDGKMSGIRQGLQHIDDFSVCTVLTPALVQAQAQVQVNAAAARPVEKIVTIDKVKYKATATCIIKNNRKIGSIVLLSNVGNLQHSTEKMISISEQLEAVMTLKDKLMSIVANEIGMGSSRSGCYENGINDQTSGCYHRNYNDSQNIKGCLSRGLSTEPPAKDGVGAGSVAEISVEVDIDVNSEADIDVDAGSAVQFFTSIEYGTVFIPDSFEILEQLLHILPVQRIKAGMKNIQIEHELDNAITVFADRRMFRLIMKNILGNAIKFTEREGKIWVYAAKGEGRVTITVKDNGVGISDERVQLLFQNINNNSTVGTEGERGVGLGLMICRQLVFQNNGDIWVESTEGEGTSFHISFPEGKTFHSIL